MKHSVLPASVSREGAAVRRALLQPLHHHWSRAGSRAGKRIELTGFLDFYLEAPRTSSPLQPTPLLLPSCCFLLHILLRLLSAPSEVCCCRMSPTATFPCRTSLKGLVSLICPGCSHCSMLEKVFPLSRPIASLVPPLPLVLTSCPADADAASLSCGCCSLWSACCTHTGCRMHQDGSKCLGMGWELASGCHFPCSASICAEGRLWLLLPERAAAVWDIPGRPD